MMGNTSNKFSPEVRGRAVRLVLDHEHEHTSRWAAITSVAGKIGCTAQPLSEWMKRAEIDAGRRAGVPTDMAAKLKALERVPRDNQDENTYCLTYRYSRMLSRCLIYFAPELKAEQTGRRAGQGCATTSLRTQEAWGIVTSGGTDGNNHGIYFGVNVLHAQSSLRPLLYVSEEAHYSIKRLADLQHLDMRLIPANVRGEMEINAFEQALDPSRPALVVIAIGTTFKGGVDDQNAIAAVLERKKPVAVYRHADAALFGGFLPFTDHAHIVSRQAHRFDSIAVSGHKFFGFDEPMGLFFTTNEILQTQNPFRVAYLDAAVPTISCSRSALGPLKFWWQMHRTGLDGYRRQAELIIKNAAYLKQRLDAIGHPAWKGEFSNTVYFQRPSDWIMEKWGLAPSEDDRLGGRLAHDIVMRHEDMHVIDRFIDDLLHARSEAETLAAPS